MGGEHYNEFNGERAGYIWLRKGPSSECDNK
jgi:hypothetical protein